jgi:hypothetical protein
MPTAWNPRTESAFGLLVLRKVFLFDYVLSKFTEPLSRSSGFWGKHRILCCRSFHWTCIVLPFGWDKWSRLTFIVLDKGGEWSVELADLLLQMVVHFLSLCEIFFRDWGLEIPTVWVGSNMGLSSTFRLGTASGRSLDWLGLRSDISWWCIISI